MRSPLLLTLALAAGLPAGGGVGEHETPATEVAADLEPGRLVYRVSASEARLNRRLMGPVRRSVQGVPSEPVDSFCWNGVGSTPVEARLELEIDPVRNLGFIKASWTDENGSWIFRQTRFVHPDEHPSGARPGSSVYQIESVINEATTNNVYLHGDTGSGMPVLPTVFTYLATWGYADVWLDGEPFLNPFEIPAPQWEGHLMVTEGARRPDGTVRTISGGIYNPSLAAEGDVEEGDLEVHLTFHDDALPVTENIPPIFSFFYHLVFEEVRMELIHPDSTEPLPAPSPSPWGFKDRPQER